MFFLAIQPLVLHAYSYIKNKTDLNKKIFDISAFRFFYRPTAMLHDLFTDITYYSNWLWATGDKAKHLMNVNTWNTLTLV